MLTRWRKHSFRGFVLIRTYKHTNSQFLSTISQHSYKPEEIIRSICTHRQDSRCTSSQQHCRNISVSAAKTKLDLESPLPASLSHVSQNWEPTRPRRKYFELTSANKTSDARVPRPRQRRCLQASPALHRHRPGVR